MSRRRSTHDMSLSELLRGVDQAHRDATAAAFHVGALTFTERLLGLCIGPGVHSIGRLAPHVQRLVSLGVFRGDKEAKLNLVQFLTSEMPTGKPGASAPETQSMEGSPPSPQPSTPPGASPGPPSSPDTEAMRWHDAPILAVALAHCLHVWQSIETSDFDLLEHLLQCISRSCERAISAEAQEADTTPAAAAAATTTHAVDIQTALAHHPTTQCMHWLCSVLFLIHMTQTGASGLLRDPSALQQRRAPTLHPMRLVYTLCHQARHLYVAVLRQGRIVCHAAMQGLVTGLVSDEAHAWKPAGARLVRTMSTWLGATMVRHGVPPSVRHQAAEHLLFAVNATLVNALLRGQVPLTPVVASRCQALGLMLADVQHAGDTAEQTAAMVEQWAWVFDFLARFLTVCDKYGGGGGGDGGVGGGTTDERVVSLLESRFYQLSRDHLVRLWQVYGRNAQACGGGGGGGGTTTHAASPPDGACASPVSPSAAPQSPSSLSPSPSRSRGFFQLLSPLLSPLGFGGPDTSDGGEVSSVDDPCHWEHLLVDTTRVRPLSFQHRLHPMQPQHVLAEVAFPEPVTQLYADYLSRKRQQGSPSPYLLVNLDDELFPMQPNPK